MGSPARQTNRGHRGRIAAAAPVSSGAPCFCHSSLTPLQRWTLALINLTCSSYCACRRTCSGTASCRRGAVPAAVQRQAAADGGGGPVDGTGAVLVSASRRTIASSRSSCKRLQSAQRSTPRLCARGRLAQPPELPRLTLDDRLKPFTQPAGCRGAQHQAAAAAAAAACLCPRWSQPNSSRSHRFCRQHSSQGSR